MVSYKNILAHVKKWEGGLVYFKTENQWTNQGIQWTTYKALAPRLLGISNPTVDGLKALTRAQAEKFIEYFWNVATNNNSITNQATANAFFEMLWGGGGYGIKWLQKVIGVYPDGRVGPKTVAAANAFPASVLVDEVLKRYNSLAKSNPAKYGGVINGWRNRWNDLLIISKRYFQAMTEELKKAVLNAKNKNNNISWVLPLGLFLGFLGYKKFIKK
jgi:lysozyme family protein|tara:strand:+ start:2052 stop:2699 length:648 start_codon:yes stop_codon:yes gene_type:complete